MRVLSTLLISLGLLATEVVTAAPVEQTQKIVSPDPDELRCLALNVYFESRGEPIEGQVAVAQVTLNRVESDHFPDTVCGVVWQTNPNPQFSWTVDGKTDEPKNPTAYNLAEAIALVALTTENVLPNLVDDSLFYHASYIEEPWFKNNLEQVTEVGEHLFYRIPES